MNQFSPAMNAAIKKLQNLVKQGVEFPDACWKVCKETGFLVDGIAKSI